MTGLLFDDRFRCPITSAHRILLVHVLAILSLPVVAVTLVVVDFSLQVDPDLTFAAVLRGG